MKNEAPKWSKNELKTYILLLCAKADWKETPEEIELIKSKSTKEIFDRLYKEISNDNEDMSLDKIEAAVERLHFSTMELLEIKKEIQEVFNSDKDFSLKEQYIDEILDNLIY
ncbi:hypothetical protein SB49_02665 [Sediminicola sp. YIK13]|uniref:hypothetical protein n=1 Tax=Sediminicola sp. YIK13 TaxID=1453352 RepID=UPI0007223BFD|nr:hypothetical protein [Sediminicola sp. YIK13]ALM06825.1 hypothetical protein SB49_02665 [Sediminicola sp. YIK13]